MSRKLRLSSENSSCDNINAEENNAVSSGIVKLLLSRRRFLQMGVAAGTAVTFPLLAKQETGAAAGQKLKNINPSDRRIAYVGCRTTVSRNARGKGISVYQVNEATGQWTLLQIAHSRENPSYLSFDNTTSFLYTVHGDNTEVSSYAIDQQTGKLTYLNTLTLDGGKNPVFITVDKTNRYLLVATLQGGRVYVIKRETNGALGAVSSSWRFPGKKADSVSCAHQCIWDQKRNYLFVPQQGRIAGYPGLSVLKFAADTGTLTQTDYFRAREYSEPRHIAIHPDNKYCYLVNEKDNTITGFVFDDKTGKIHPQQIIPVLPETYTGDGQSSAILVDKTGQWVVESTRIHDSISVFKINPLNGYLTRSDTLKIPGKTPRFITFNDAGDRLYVANEDSDTIIQYAFDTHTGRLTLLPSVIKTGSPVCLLFK